MTPNEVKLLKKYFKDAFGRTWPDALIEFEQKKLADARRHFEVRRGRPTIETLLSEIESLPE